MTAWLVIPKTADGPPQMDKARVETAASPEAAAAVVYGNAIVLGPLSVFTSDATHHDGPRARPA